MATVCGLAVPLTAQLAPPFHVLTHEFSQLFTGVAAVVAFYLSAWIASRFPQGTGLSSTTRLSLALSVSATAMATMAAVAFTTMVVANALGPHCRMEAATVFFWITWPPAVALAAVMGIALGDRGWRWPYQTAVLGGVIALALLQDTAQAMWGANVMDLWVGKPLAFDVRADMAVPRVHGLQRLVVAGMALGLWNLLLWRRGLEEVGSDAEAASRAARHRFALTAAGLAMALCAGSHVGLGWGKGALHGHLSGEVRTEHCVVRFAPGGDAALFAEAIARDAEWHLSWIADQWQYEPRHDVWIYVFEGSREIAAYTPTRSSHVMGHSIRVTTRSALSPTLLHELVHVMHYDLVGPTMVLAGRGIIEGLAIAFEDDYVFHSDAHGRQAGALEGDTLPRATDVMSLLGFWKVDEGNAYDAAGSFVGFLIAEHGWDRFVQLQDGFDYKGVYGRSLADLDDDWRAFLAGVPVAMEEMAAARESFDPALQPAYSDECCPKLGARATVLEEEAIRRWDAGDLDGALVLFDQLRLDEDTPHWTYQAVQCLRRMRRDVEAIDRIDDLLAREELEEDEQFRFLWTRLFCAMALSDWSEVEVTIAHLDALEAPTPDRAAMWACLRDPDLRRPVAFAMTDATWFQGRSSLEALMAQHPQRPELRYVYGIASLGVPSGRRQLGFDPWIHQRVHDVLSVTDTTPGLADEFADDLLRLADDAVRAGQFDLARSICEGVRDRSHEPLHRLGGERCIERLAWEVD